MYRIGLWRIAEIKVSTLLVAYGLNKRGQDYSGFHNLIKKYAYAKLSESSYSIQNQDAPQTVFNKLTPHMDNNDHVYVVTLTPPFVGRGLQAENNWLNQSL